MWTVILLVLVGCGDKEIEEIAPPEPVEEVATEEPAPVEEIEPELPALQPQALYQDCLKRVEGPEAEGECSTDADCTRAGCAQEVCLPAAQAAELMTTCEDKLCYKALDTCGCHEGRCTWTLVDGPIPRGRKVMLPPPELEMGE